MEFPFGHHNRHHHKDDEEEVYPPQPPPPTHHTHHSDYPPPAQPAGYRDEPRHPFQPPPPQPHYNAYQEERQPDRFGYQNAPPSHPPTYNRFDSEPSYPPVQHVSHQGYEPDPYEGRHETHHRPHLPSFVHHQSHQGGASDISGKPTIRVFTKAEDNYSLTIREGKVVLARSNPNDPSQHWIKDLKFSTRVKDEEGYPSFALVNQATGQAIKHSIGATHPVQLTPYNPDVLDESVLWTESKDLGDTFRAVRMVNNIRLNLDAFNGDKNHGGVHDGTTVVLWEWKKGDNQRWKIAPH